MRWIIDGHNLIPGIPGMRLSDLDDEQALITWLQEAARFMQDTIDVYFDGAPPGQPARRSHGRVTAYFVRQGTTADQAIWTRLEREGAKATQFSVVSSDHLVQRGARKAHAKAVTAEEFITLVAAKSQDARSDAGQSPHLNNAEIEEWLRLFNDRWRDPK